MNFIKSMLSGSDDSISTTRVITVLTAFTILGVYIAQNVLAMIKCGGFIDFPANSIMALLVVMGAKVGQSFTENLNKASAKDKKDPAKPNYSEAQ